MRVGGGILAALMMLGVAGQGYGPLASSANAQTSTPTQMSILTIDQERLFAGSLFGERVAAQINKDLAKLEQEFQRLEADLTAEEQDLTQRRATLPPDDFRLLADAFDEKVQGIRKAQDAKARELDRRLELERAKYYGLINPILTKIMEDLGASVIVDRRAILISVEGVDITDGALRMIDATLGDGIAPPVAADD